MSQSFNCPNCGATLEYPGSGRTMNCGYCNTLIQVPKEVWEPLEAAQQQVELQKTEKRWVRYLVIFLVVTVGLPLCLGLVGTVVGLLASLLGVTLPFILPSLIH
jgi:hypothetical protein